MRFKRWFSNRNRLCCPADVLLLVGFCCLFLVSTRDISETTPSFSQEYVDYLNATKSVSIWLVDARGPECNAQGKRYTNNQVPLPFVVLLSPAGSGNTWTRWMIEHMTGICTVASDFLCEMDSINSSSAIVYKSHYFEHLTSRKMLFLIRNPYAAMIAEFNRQKTNDNHTGLADDRAFYTEEWRAFVKMGTLVWISQVKKAFEIAEDILVVFYENLKRNLTQELYRIAGFLQVRVDDARIQCTINKSRVGQYKRPKRSKSANKIFTFKEIENMNTRIKQAFVLFKSHGVPNIPEFYRQPWKMYDTL